jgi:hypothetical protein
MTPAPTARQTAADGVAHPGGGGTGDAQRHHEREGDQVERDLVPGELGDAHPAHEQGDGKEEAQLERVVQADRQTDPEQTRVVPQRYRRSRETAPVRPERPPRGGQQAQEHHPAGGGAGMGRARHAQGGEAEMSEDQGIVADDVDQVGQHDGHHGGTDQAHRLERLPEDSEQEKGDVPPGDRPDVGRRLAEDLGLLPQGAEHRPRLQHGERDRQGERRRQDDSTLEVGADRRPVIRAERLRHQRVERREDSRAEHEQRDADDVAERAGGERLRR